MTFRWIRWNLEKLAKHGVGRLEAEAVVNGAEKPYPSKSGGGKWMVRGRGTGGRLVQVVFLYDDDGTAFVIHAMPLSPKQKKRERRKGR